MAIRANRDSCTPTLEQRLNMPTNDPCVTVEPILATTIPLSGHSVVYLSNDLYAKPPRMPEQTLPTEEHTKEHVPDNVHWLSNALIVSNPHDEIQLPVGTHIANKTRTIEANDVPPSTY